MDDICNYDAMWYCKGCGHRYINMLVANAIGKLGIQDKTVLVAPAGCGAYIGDIIQAASIFAPHGRGISVATGIKNADPDSVVLAYMGDGDMTGIGLADSLHGIRRNHPLTIIMVNNSAYGMTGGQLAPTTLLGGTTKTTPEGSPYLPIDICDLARRVNPNAFVYRGVNFGDHGDELPKMIEYALEIQMKGGISVVEILSPCPTTWRENKLEQMIEQNQIGIINQGQTTERVTSSRLTPRELFQIDFSGYQHIGTTAALELKIAISGVGGQGIQTLGKWIAGHHAEQGLNTTVLPNYGAQKIGGKSDCIVKVSEHPIVSPFIQPDVADIAVVLDKDRNNLEEQVKERGVLFFNPETHNPERPDILTIPITKEEGRMNQLIFDLYKMFLKEKVIQ